MFSKLIFFINTSPNAPYGLGLESRCIKTCLEKLLTYPSLGSGLDSRKIDLSLFENY